jgi:hypothetical protein
LQKQGGQCNISYVQHQQRFSLEIRCSALAHNFNNVFSNEHLYLAGQLMNSLPSQLLKL